MKIDFGNTYDTQYNERALRYTYTSLILIIWDFPLKFYLWKMIAS